MRIAVTLFRWLKATATLAVSLVATAILIAMVFNRGAIPLPEIGDWTQVDTVVEAGGGFDTDVDWSGSPTDTGPLALTDWEGELQADGVTVGVHLLLRGDGTFQLTDHNFIEGFWSYSSEGALLRRSKWDETPFLSAYLNGTDLTLITADPEIPTTTLGTLRITGRVLGDGTVEMYWE